MVKSAFELEWDAQLPANQDYLLTGRSWSGNGSIAYTDVSTDGGQSWHRTKLIGFPFGACSGSGPVYLTAEPVHT